MKVTYTFDTDNDNYDAQEHEMIKQAQCMASALYEIKSIMRNWLKYDSAPLVGECSHFWDRLTEDEKQRYIQYKQYDIDRMTDQIYEAIVDSGVNMEKMGY